MSTRVRTILVSGIEYRPILSLYSHAILVSSDGWCNCCDVMTAAAFD